MNRKARRAVGLKPEPIKTLLDECVVSCRVCRAKNVAHNNTRDGKWMRLHMHGENRVEFDWRIGKLRGGRIGFVLDPDTDFGQIDIHPPGGGKRAEIKL